MWNNMKNVKLMIVGCGAIAEKAHLPALRRISQVDISALVDINMQRANELKSKYILSDINLEEEYEFYLEYDWSTPTGVGKKTESDVYAYRIDDQLATIFSHDFGKGTSIFIGPRFGFTSADAEIFRTFIESLLKRLSMSVAKAKDKETGLFYSYFFYEVKDYEINKDCFVNPLSFKRKNLPLFLEASVHMFVQKNYILLYRI